MDRGLDRGGVVEALVFGSPDSGVVDRALADFCQAQLGSPVAETLFRATSVGVVAGLRLADDRRVVVKAHQPRESRSRLEEVHRVQAHLHREGFPCPRPLLPPTRLGEGLAVVEELVDDGSVRDTHEPAGRRLMAEALAWHLELARACGRPSALAEGWTLYVRDRLWPREAHAPIFDFEATADGAEWIDTIAAKAKPLAAEDTDLLVGHHDWSGKHFRFGDGRITVVYDWDSLGLGREAVIVGNAAMTFTTNFELPGVRRAPTPEEMRAFIDEYSDARHVPLGSRERERVAACATFLLAYTARCEHCGGGDEDATSFRHALRTYGEQYLRP